MRDLFRLDVRTATTAALIAGPMGMMWFLGYRIDLHKITELQWLTDFQQVTRLQRMLAPGGTISTRRMLLVAAVVTIAAFVGIVVFLNWLRRRPSGTISATPNRRWFLTTWVVLAACWLPYLWFMWPGQVTADPFTQIRQALGQLPFSDHHPILMTLTIKALLVPLNAVTGSITTSLGIMAGIQLLLISGIFAHSLMLLRRFRAPAGLYRALVVFLAVNPVVAWYSITLWKDVWLGVFILWAASLGVCLMADVLTDESVPRHRWLLFAAQLALICSAKKTGPYIVVALGIVLVAAMLWRRGLSWRQRLISARPLALALVGGLVVHIGIHTAAMTVLEASPGSPVEAYSVPVQQMARIVRYHHDDITEQQHQELRQTAFPF